jgi:hypothetical protein
MQISSREQRYIEVWGSRRKTPRIFNLIIIIIIIKEMSGQFHASDALPSN